MPDFKRPEYELIESEGKLREVVEKELSPRDTIAVDTEADKLDPYLANLILIQIGTPERAYIFDAQKIKDFSPLKRLFESKKPLKILQNAKFDYKMLKVQTGLELVNIYDTFLAERILTCGESRGVSSLLALGQKYLHLELDKDWESYDWEGVARSGNITERHLKYAALDVLVLFPIFKKQFQQLKSDNLLEVAKLEFACCPVVAEMEIHGSYIDQEKWRRNIRELEQKRDKVRKRIQNELRPLYETTQTDLFGNHVDVVNLNSPVQILAAFEKVGIDIPSTGEAVLKKVNHPLAKMLLEYRSYEKLITAFGANLLEHIHPKTGRLHPDYMQIGADTGRFSCSKPNLQQIPKESEFRGCFVAPRGRRLVTADYSQIELRILAEMSGDPALIKAFESGKEPPDFNAEARGAFAHVTLKHTRWHFARAIIESATFTMKENIDLIRSRGAAVDEIRSLGGGAKSDLWLQMKADILNVPVRRPVIQEAATFGDALMAGTGAGIYPDLVEASERLCRFDRTFEPRPEVGALYEEPFERYRALYRDLYAKT